MVLSFDRNACWSGRGGSHSGGSLPAHRNAQERAMLSTLTFMSIVVMLGFCLVLIILWPWILTWLEELQAMPPSGLALLVLYLVFVVPWGIASQVLIVDRIGHWGEKCAPLPE